MSGANQNDEKSIIFVVLTDVVIDPSLPSVAQDDKKEGAAQDDKRGCDRSFTPLRSVQDDKKRGGMLCSLG